ncbi:helix-turn-helix domain-containing protein [Parabacteroides distasonis]|uniref:helix-turn-helix domain-containing protein n=1 Tax=Parabacteroides distasonis TaxID=823 RepID=UPI0032C15517
MRIKEILKERGITQQDLADMLGVSHQSIKQTLNASSVTTSTLEKIASALEVPMWELFASPNDIHPQAKTIICPHCQKPIPVEVDIKVNEEQP